MAHSSTWVFYFDKSFKVFDLVCYYFICIWVPSVNYTPLGVSFTNDRHFCNQNACGRLYPMKYVRRHWCSLLPFIAKNFFNNGNFDFAWTQYSYCISVDASVTLYCPLSTNITFYEWQNKWDNTERSCVVWWNKVLQHNAVVNTVEICVHVRNVGVMSEWSGAKEVPEQCNDRTLMCQWHLKITKTMQWQNSESMIVLNWFLFWVGGSCVEASIPMGQGACQILNVSVCFPK